MRKYNGEGWKPKKVAIPWQERFPDKTETDLLLDVVTSQIGVEEKPRGSNKGKEVEMYLRSIGLNGGYAWCMAFVYWCFKQTYKEIQESTVLVRTGGVLRQWNELGKQYRFSEPQRGDIFIMDYGRGRGHTGIVDRVEYSYIYTIEGNTNYKGSREGYKVERKKRRISKCKGFLRIFSC